MVQWKPTTNNRVNESSKSLNVWFSTEFNNNIPTTELSVPDSSSVQISIEGSGGDYSPSSGFEITVDNNQLPLTEIAESPTKSEKPVKKKLIVQTKDWK
jgi:hypothetical protein